MYDWRVKNRMFKPKLKSRMKKLKRQFRELKDNHKNELLAKEMYSNWLMFEK